MGTMVESLDLALGDAKLPPWAAPTAELARRYAQLIDDGESVLKVGPRLEGALARLGLTAAAQGPAASGGSSNGGEDHDPVAELADDLADRARERRAAARHAAVAGADA